MSDEEEKLAGDFNTYCMNIAGTLSYVLAGKINKIPQGQIEMLERSFFDFFKQYKFFKDEIETYIDFFQQYKAFEQARTLLLHLLSK